MKEQSQSESTLLVRTPEGINSDSSISELIEFTRSSFMRSDFEMVEKILLDREKEVKEKFEAEICDLIRKNLELEEENVRLKSDFNELQEKLESRVLSLEKDFELIKEQFQSQDDEIKQNEEPALESAERASGNSCKEASGKSSNEDPGKSPKRDLGKSSKEAPGKSLKEAFGNPSPAQSINQLQLDVIEISDSDDEGQKVDETNTVQKASVHASNNVSLPADKLPDDDEVTETTPILNFSMRKRRRVVCVDDEDDADDVSMLDGAKRKKSSKSDDGDVNIPAGELVADVANSGPVIRSCDEITKGGKIDLSGVSSDSSDDDEDLTDACLDSLAAVKSSNPVIKNCEEANTNIKVWADEVVMKKDFVNEEDLCLNAVCALFYETEFEVKPLDAERVNELAKILVDGDLNGKITKSSSELKETHPGIVDECRKLAEIYSKTLFQVYKNKKNPFFPYPKI